MNLYLRLRNGAATRDEGQALAEYGLLLGLIAVVVIAAVTLLGGQIDTILGAVTTALGTAMP